MKAQQKQGVMVTQRTLWRAAPARLAILVVGLLAAAGSANSNRAKPQKASAESSIPDDPPQSREMEPAMALGLWKSSFGPVKIEEASGESVHGVWVYDRQMNGRSEEVIGYFEGRLDGNVLEFTWQEPAAPQPLVGEGYLVFDPDGRAFRGKWWTDGRDRSGVWNGWRTPDTTPTPDGIGGDDYDDADGDDYDDRDGPAEQADGPPPDDYL